MKKSFTVLSAAADTVRDVQLFRQNTLHLYTKMTASPITALWWLEEASHNTTGASDCFFPFCQLLCQCWQVLFSTFVWPAITNCSSASLPANIFFFFFFFISDEAQRRLQLAEQSRCLYFIWVTCLSLQLIIKIIIWLICEGFKQASAGRRVIVMKLAI